MNTKRKVFNVCICRKKAALHNPTTARHTILKIFVYGIGATEMTRQKCRDTVSSPNSISPGLWPPDSRLYLKHSPYVRVYNIKQINFVDPATTPVF